MNGLELYLIFDPMIIMILWEESFSEILRKIKIADIIIVNKVILKGIVAEEFLEAKFFSGDNTFIRPWLLEYVDGSAKVSIELMNSDQQWAGKKTHCHRKWLKGLLQAAVSNLFQSLPVSVRKNWSSEQLKDLIILVVKHQLLWMWLRKNNFSRCHKNFWRDQKKKQVIWQCAINDQRPKVKTQIIGIEIVGLLDVDITLISPIFCH